MAVIPWRDQSIETLQARLNAGQHLLQLLRIIRDRRGLQRLHWLIHLHLYRHHWIAKTRADLIETLPQNPCSRLTLPAQVFQQIISLSQ